MSYNAYFNPSNQNANLYSIVIFHPQFGKPNCKNYNRKLKTCILDFPPRIRGGLFYNHLMSVILSFRETMNKNSFRNTTPTT